MVEPPRIDHQGPVHECRPSPGYPVTSGEGLKKTDLGWQLNSLSFPRIGPGRPQEAEALHPEDLGAKIPGQRVTPGTGTRRQNPGTSDQRLPPLVRPLNSSVRFQCHRTSSEHS